MLNMTKLSIKELNELLEIGGPITVTGTDDNSGTLAAVHLKLGDRPLVLRQESYNLVAYAAPLTRSVRNVKPIPNYDGVSINRPIIASSSETPERVIAELAEKYNCDPSIFGVVVA